MDAPRKLNGMGTWRRYKLGQAQFTSWLKQTADKLVNKKGDPAADTNSNGNTPDTQNNDGTATPQQSRRQKKKAKAATVNLDTENDKFVHWSQLEVLAQRVADNGNPEDVPQSALNILRDVVNLRKKSFSFFSDSTKDTKDEKIKQSNASHAHIISVLERVLAKLDSLVKASGFRERTKESKDNAQVAMSDLSNMFEYLDVQPVPDALEDGAAAESDDETSSISSNNRQNGAKRKGGKKAPKALKGKKSQKPKRQSEAAASRANDNDSWVDNFRFGLPGEDEDEDEDDEFDLYMMVYCFFVDFNAIRNHVAERWCDYWYEKSVPLDTLAVITNAAFELFHQLEHDLTKELRQLNPKLARYEFMMSMLFYNYGIDHIDYDSYDDLSDDESSERIWRDEADWLALFSYFSLHRSLEMIPPGKTPTIYGANNADTWRNFESSVIMQIVLEGAHLKALKKNEQEPPVLPSESQILLDFQESLKRVDYNSALIFSLHLWVDIRNIIETDHVKPFEELQTTATKLKRALETHNPTKYSRDHDFKRRWIGRVWETKHYMLEDFMFEDKQARFRQIGILEDPSPFYLLKHEPVWAGLLDFRAKLVYSQLGQEFVLFSRIVDAAAHVYYAALAADPGITRWEVMEQHVETYTEDSPWRVGLRDARGAAAIIRAFAERVAGGPQHEGAKSAAHSDGGAKNSYIPAVAVRQTLFWRYALDDRSAPFVEYLAELNSKGQRKADPAVAVHHHRNGHCHHGDTNGGSVAVANAPLDAANKPAGWADEQRKASLSHLSPVEMLQRLDDAVTAQVSGLLTLDYFQLFDESVALLEAVAAACGPEMESRLGSGDNDSHTYLEGLPVLLAQDLQSSSAPVQSGIVDTVVKGCRQFLG